MRLRPWAVVVVVAFIVPASSKPSVAFRLYDIQCGWLVPIQIPKKTWLTKIYRMQSNSMDIIDAFNKHGIPLTVGVVTGPGNCYVEDLRLRLANNSRLELASHSVTHRHMTSLSMNDLFNEIVDSKSTLEALFNRNITLFIPPCKICLFVWVLLKGLKMRR